MEEHLLISCALAVLFLFGMEYWIMHILAKEVSASLLTFEIPSFRQIIYLQEELAMTAKDSK